jgi:hypothetical protein
MGGRRRRNDGGENFRVRKGNLLFTDVEDFEKFIETVCLVERVSVHGLFHLPSKMSLTRPSQRFICSTSPMMLSLLMVRLRDLSSAIVSLISVAEAEMIGSESGSIWRSFLKRATFAN